VSVDGIPEDRKVRIGISFSLKEKMKAEGLPGHIGARHQFRRDERNDSENAQGADDHQPLEAPVRYNRIPPREEELADFGIATLDSSRRRLRRWRCGLGREIDLGGADLWHLFDHLGQATGAM
jgi:hypothetical protein